VNLSDILLSHKTTSLGKKELHLQEWWTYLGKKLVIYMDDLTSRDEEKAREKDLKAEQERQRNEQKAREQATETGRKEEQARQKEREQAAEKGRKEGMEQERARQKARGGSGTGVKIVILLIVLVIAAAVIAWFSVSVTNTSVTPGIALPFTTNYAVSFPEGQTVTLGNNHINILSVQNEVITDIDGDRQKLVVGEQRVIPERRGKITILGVTLLDTNYVITLTYKGERDNRAYFDMEVQTSKQVPDMLLKRLLPPEIDARLV
jgi:hypothetical protein